jgi:hypothetical protein
MWLFKYGVPVLAILGFGHGVYEIFTGKFEIEKMGIPQNVAKMLGVAALVMTILWILILFALTTGAVWLRYLAILATGMYIFDYLVALALYKNTGDSFFKYWGGAAGILMISYSIWL